ncbi:MAG: monooxygenase [Chloroflexi bacterium]|nr:MAG: monooxygenase [Chloroflexota bacterium]
MIATLVLFPTAGAIDLDDATGRFNGTAPAYRGRAGLRTKAYIYAEDGSDLGGFYIWESRAAADAVFDAAWREKVTSVYGVAPVVRYFDVPVLVENGGPEP